jgi:hypothetical protein
VGKPDRAGFDVTLAAPTGILISSAEDDRGRPNTLSAVK